MKKSYGTNYGILDFRPTSKSADRALDEEVEEEEEREGVQGVRKPVMPVKMNSKIPRRHQVNIT